MKDVTGQDIQLLIDMFEESDWKELSLQSGDFRLYLSRDPAHTVPGWLRETASQAPPPAPSPARSPGMDAAAPAAVPAAAHAAAPAPDLPEGAVAVRAPNLGVFYRAPKPGAAPYASVGDRVAPDTEICLIEVMKLFTPVVAGIAGVILHICAEDGEMIEFDQPLFYIQPQD